MSFYRKYRPSVIAELDNADIRHRLSSLLTKDRSQLPHAYLFSGPKGTGKTTSARIIAKLFLCEHPSKTDGPCGTCAQCVSVAEGRNMDVIEIDAASNRGIDEIRELKSAISLSPTTGDFKVYIIDEVHMLTTEAFNALLKTLEEPPRHAVFVLATTDPQKVPSTIRSRCVEFTFHKATASELSSAIARIARAEKFTIDEDALSGITTAADGAFRDAVKMLEQVSFEGSHIVKSAVDRMIPATGGETVTAFLAALSSRDPAGAVSIAETAVSEGRDMAAFAAGILDGIHGLLLSSVTTGTAAAGWTAADLTRASDLFHTAYQQLKFSPHPVLPIESAIVTFCGAPSGQSAPPSAKPHDPARSAAADPPVPAPKKREAARDAHTDTPHAAVPDATLPPKPDAAPAAPVPSTVPPPPSDAAPESAGMDLLTIDKLKTHWQDVIDALKTYNHSVSGVLRSARPKSVEEGKVTIEAFYSFHKERLSEPKTRDILAGVLKKLFGANVQVEIVLGTK